jgi:cytochrome b6-f complex iron-sulfur subunit
MESPMPLRLVQLLLSAYPRAYRERYGAEMAAVLEERMASWRDLLDLARGALDARLDPQIDPPRVLAAAAAVSPAVAGSPAPLAPRAPYGVVASTPPVGELSRRVFMRRMLAAGVGLLSLEFIAGTLAFTWPQVRSGLGGKFGLGTPADILAIQPNWAQGWPYPYTKARLFLINVPAAKELALGHEASVQNPTADQLLALWRKCPHLGCQIPQLCESLKRFTCNCHQSTYNILGEKLKSGPAARGMDRFAVSIGDDGGIVVDTSKVTAGAPNLGPDALTFKDPFPWDAACR